MSVLLKIWESRDGCTSDGSQIQSQLLGLFRGVLSSFLCDLLFTLQCFDEDEAVILWCMAVNTKSSPHSLNAFAPCGPWGSYKSRSQGPAENVLAHILTEEQIFMQL